MVRQQEELDLDVLVHGEAERNDMVEYFGELLDGLLSQIWLGTKLRFTLCETACDLR